MNPQLPTPTRTAPRIRRSPLLIIAGAVLVIAGSLATAGIYSQLSETQEVIVIVSTVARGEQIQRSDLTTAQVGFDPLLKPLLGGELNWVVGQYATADLVPGTFLTAGAVGEQPSPRPGQALIGLALAAGEYPDTPLFPGDSVLLVSTEGRQSGPALTFTASLVSISPATASTRATVTVLVDLRDAAELAGLASSGQVVLVLTSRGG